MRIFYHQPERRIALFKNDFIEFCKENDLKDTFIAECRNQNTDAANAIITEYAAKRLLWNNDLPIERCFSREGYVFTHFKGSCLLYDTQVDHLRGRTEDAKIDVMSIQEYIDKRKG
jgi:hypothetical protein